MNEGGDKRTVRAKVDIARRETEIVTLKLRGIPTHEIARVIGISQRAVQGAFNKALRRQTEDALDDWHRTELAGLAMEAANVWRVMDAHKDDPKVQLAGEDRLLRIHIRRAKLLGLDAPTKLDISGIYRKGENQQSAESLARQRVFEAMTEEEQEAIYEKFEEARRRGGGAIETTPTVISGTDNRDIDDAKSDDEAWSGNRGRDRP
jgi:hypothetical protein